jgi:glycosyltransferase involved in cell wall biosynthesis
VGSDAERKPGLFVSYRDTYVHHETGSADGYAHALAADIATALSANDWPCVPVAPWLDADLGGVFAGRLPPFVLNFNLLPKDVVATVRRAGIETQESIYALLSESLGTPVICVLLDHAAHHLPNIVLNAYAARNVRFAYFEKSSWSFLSGLGIPRERAIHLRWGGPPPDQHPKPIACRRGGVVFHGSLRPVKAESDFFRAAAALSVPAVLAEAALAAVAPIIEEDADTYVALLAEIRRRGIDPASVLLGVKSFLLSELDLRSRYVRRERFLTAFAGLPVDFFGTFPNEFAAKFPRATFHGSKSYGEVMAFTRDAKLVLCENLNWQENIHPRVTYAMAQGTPVLAESSAVLRASFADMKNIALVSHPYRDAAEKAEALFADPALAQALADAARPVYEAGHTWREVVKALAPLLPPPVSTKPTKARRGAKSVRKARSRRARRP